MSSNPTFKIEKPLQLSEDTLSAARQLVAACEAAEPAPVRVSWRMLRTRAGVTPLDFCCYLDGALAGYLFMDPYNPKERETIILVHPAYRRRGIAHALLAEAYKECQRTGVERIILICERRAVAGKAFVEHFAARFDFAEHEMALGAFQPRDSSASYLNIRLADLDDLDALVAIDAACFNQREEEARERFIRRWHDQHSRQYIALLASEGTAAAEPVGMFRLSAEDGATGIYGLGIAPAHQGRGYGRQILEEAVRRARADDPQAAVMLDVDVDNTRAFNLYTSAGFQVRATYEYYALNVSE